jgi:hypothetical protein
MYITLTNASEAHRGNKVAVKVSEIISVYETTVTRESGVLENITLVYAPPHGTWEVSDTLDDIVNTLNGVKK